jgi:hypothetical protein
MMLEAHAMSIRSSRKWVSMLILTLLTKTLKKFEDTPSCSTQGNHYWETLSTTTHGRGPTIEGKGKVFDKKYESVICHRPYVAKSSNKI